MENIWQCNRSKLFVGVSATAMALIFVWLSGRLFEGNMQMCRGQVQQKSEVGKPKATEVKVIKPRTQRTENINNTGAMPYLKDYARRFEQNQLLATDPNVPSSIDTWWKAAAVMDWYMEASVTRFKCKNIQAMGNWHICQDPPYTIKPPCLVYSVGINNDFSFDDAMAKLGCEVHSFDPSMKKPDHKRSANVTFHNLGLSHTNLDAFNPRKDVYTQNDPPGTTWKMRTLKSIIKMIGHENRIIDVFKFDIEGYEWQIVDNLIETGMLPRFRQLLTEWHMFTEFPARSEYVHMYQIYSRLRELGFREFRKWHHKRQLNLQTFRHQADCEFVSAFFNKEDALL